jgi:hypothetical protein
MAPPLPARPGVVWDDRFRLSVASAPPAGTTLGALGPRPAAALRRLPAARPLQAAVLATLPALWRHAELVAVPHLGYPDANACRGVRLDFAPCLPVAGAPFLPAAA